MNKYCKTGVHKGKLLRKWFVKVCPKTLWSTCCFWTPPVSYNTIQNFIFYIKIIICNSFLLAYENYFYRRSMCIPCQKKRKTIKTWCLLACKKPILSLNSFSRYHNDIANLSIHLAKNLYACQNAKK